MWSYPTSEAVITGSFSITGVLVRTSVPTASLFVLSKGTATPRGIPPVSLRPCSPGCARLRSRTHVGHSAFAWGYGACPFLHCFMPPGERGSGSGWGAGCGGGTGTAGVGWLARASAILRSISAATCAARAPHPPRRPWRGSRWEGFGHELAEVLMALKGEIRHGIFHLGGNPDGHGR